MSHSIAGMPNQGRIYGEYCYNITEKYIALFFCSPKAFFDTRKVLKGCLRPALRLGLCRGSSRRSPRPPSRLGRGHPSPLQSPPISTPSACPYRRLRCLISVSSFRNFFSCTRPCAKPRLVSCV